MDHETMRSLIGTILLWAMAIAAAAWLIWKNRALIREICWNENGKFDPLGGLERYFARGGQDEDPDPDTVTADEDFMALLMRQKGARMAGFDPERDRIREHIIFRGRVQGVGFRYQAMYVSIPGDVCFQDVRSDRMGGEPAGRLGRDGGPGNSRGDRKSADASSKRTLDPHRRYGSGGDPPRERRARFRCPGILTT